MKKLFLTTAIVVTALVSNAQRLTEADRNTIRLAEQEGYVKCDCSSNTIYIKPIVWNNLPYQGKENIGAMYAIKCEEIKRNGLYYMNIHDYYSGKKLAKYSKSWGFKMY